MRIPYTITERAISLIVDNRPRIVDRSNANFEALKAALRKTEHDMELIKDLADISRFISRATFGAVQVGDAGVRWNGAQIHHVIADKLIGMLREGSDLEPLARFLDRLMENPVQSSRNELYQWLEAGSAPITPEGTFLAYKAVRSDYKDKHAGLFDNSVGQVLSMPREAVDANRNNHCSRGFHFCQYGYLSSFAGQNDPIMIVEIDPADVVSIPTDYGFQKGRTWKYKVIGEVPRDDVNRDIWEGRYVVSDYHETVETEHEIEDEDNIPDLEAVHESLLDVLAAERPSMASLLNTAIEAPEPIQPMPEPTKADYLSSMVFQGGGKTYTGQQIADAVNEHGQRGGARALGVSKSTIQGWWSRIKG